MYETQIIYKVAPHGEGKTKWLAERALNEQEEGNEIYLLNEDVNRGSLQFRRFMELFYTQFNKLATIHHITDVDHIPCDSIVLIDDLLSHNIPLSNIYKLRGKVKKIYITLEGTNWKNSCNCNNKCKSNIASSTNQMDDRQISIFDIEECEVSLNG